MFLFANVDVVLRLFGMTGSGHRLRSESSLKERLFLKESVIETLQVRLLRFVHAIDAI